MKCSGTGTRSSIQFSDGIDNDRDGFVDSADPGCANGNDPSERGDHAECDNGLDDDSGGEHDFPDDAECSTATGSSAALTRSFGAW